MRRCKSAERVELDFAIGSPISTYSSLLMSREWSRPDFAAYCCLKPSQDGGSNPTGRLW